MVSGVQFPGEPPHLNILSVLTINAGVAELADALDLGSSANGMGVQVPSPAPYLKLCGSGSVVERHLAKVNVASSNLVFRSRI